MTFEYAWVNTNGDEFMTVGNLVVASITKIPENKFKYLVEFRELDISCDEMVNYLYKVKSIEEARQLILDRKDR